MEQTRLENTKFRDFVLGFVGWFLYANFLFGLILYEIVDLPRVYENLLSYLILGAIWLPVLLLPPIWSSQGRRWLGLGMIGAAALNIGVYLVISLLSGAPAGWTGCLIPLPTSVLVWFGD